MKEEVFGSIRFLSGGSFPLSTDSVLLSAFARCRPGEAVCDLGCGSGAISLLLLSRDRTLRLTGVELLDEAAAAAEENIRRNGLEAQFRVLRGDLRQIRTLLPAGRFSCVVSNPPYFPAGSGAQRSGAETARSERSCSPDELFSAAAWLLPSGGRFCLVHRPERLTDLLCAARTYRLEPKRIRFVRHRPDAPISLLLLECRRNGGAGLQFEPDLLLHNADGCESAEARAIYHWEEP